MNDVLKDKLTDIAALLMGLGKTIGDIVMADEPETVTAEPKKEEPPKQPEKKYTLEDVRKALAEKSSAGFTDQVRELLEKHGGAKLSAIDPAEYPAIMEEAKEIGS